MLFFDNEGINCEEVGQLGVCCVHCPGGMSQGAWEKGLSTYARAADGDDDDQEDPPRDG